MENIPFEEVNRVTLKIREEDKTLEDLFKRACEFKVVKNFIKTYPNIINSLNLVLGQPKAQSIHACAVMIFPKEKEMFNWVPIRLQNDNYVSEWEGGELDSAGFLKQDILGILQLDKFTNILDLIKENTGENIDIYSIPLDDNKVYKFFKKGLNEDVFHFGSKGLTSYCKELKPENIDELIAAISLYRPGAIENNFHNEYVSRKFGEKDVEYFVGSKEILKNTYGVFVFQEQIMKLCQVLGGLSLTEADDVRKAMVKKKYEALHQYRERFIKYYQDNFQISEEYSIKVWDTIDRASTYLFNRSHAAAYAITGYISQYLKVYYPIEYWITAFKYAKDTDYSRYISEIYKTGDIKISFSDINESNMFTIANFKENKIYWALSSIRDLGTIANNQIIKDRNENGKYFSFEEFYDRNHFKGSKVNKRSFKNLILSGSFDKIENIKQPVERMKLINSLNELTNSKKEDFFYDERELFQFNWWWQLQQKKLSGVSFFNYEEMVDVFIEDKSFKYLSNIDFNSKDLKILDKIAIGGYITEVYSRKGKGGQYAKIVLESNYDFIDVLIYANQYYMVENIINNLEKKIMIISGKISKDNRTGNFMLTTKDNTEIYILG